MSTPPRRPLARRPLFLSSLGVLLASCPAARRAVQGPDDDGEDEPAIAQEEEGLRFTLSEGRPEAGAAPRPTLAQAEPLGEREVKALLARLPALAAEPADVQPFALRPASRPPPRTGTTVLASFPGPAAGPPPAVKPGPLTVLRHGPDGEVPVAADLSITFSQPMVAVTSRDQLAAADVPVTLTPQPPGQWTWVGTRTLQFRPTGRFPMATEYRVDVPAGVTAASGEKLSQKTSFTFATPPPRLVSASPRDTTTARSPAIFLAFDQRIEPAAVLPKLRLVPEGGEAVPLQLVARAEAVKDVELRRLVEGAEDGRWLVVRPTRALPGDSAIAVHLDPGLPSAEGPRTTTTGDRFAFRTHGALVLAAARCGWDDRCPPDAPLRFLFSNVLDARRFKKEWIRVEPEIPGMTAAVSGNEVHVQGATRARTSYQVTIGAELRDTFRQRLGAPVSHTFKVGPAPENLHALSGPLTVLDPAAGGKFSVFTTNHRRLKVRVHAVTPADWDAYGRYQSATLSDVRADPPLPGRPVFSDTIKIGGDPDVLHETPIDLNPALRRGLGHAIVLVEPDSPPKEPWMRQRVLAWVQATNIGLDAFADGDKLVAYTSALATGAPLAGVELALVPSGARTVSDREGLGTLALPPRGNRLLLAVRGEDQALLPEQADGYYEDSVDAGWRPRTLPDDLLWHVFDDRQMYRPGETVRVKGWLRVRGRGPRGALALPGDRARELRYALHDSQGNKLLTGTRALHALGGFDLALELPKTPNLGHAFLELEVIAGGMKGRTHTHSLQIQEFRRPEYEVTARADEGPHVVGGHAALTVAAKYYAGGPLAGAEVRWAVSATPGHYTPPGRDGYTFGRWRPWWGHVWGIVPESHYREPETFASRTDAAGEHHLRADFIRVAPIEPTSLYAEATVTDVNRQAWTASTRLLVHPAGVYVGLKSERLFVQQGEPLRVDAIAVDLDGKAVLGREIVMRATRLAWEQVAGQWQEVERDPQECRKASGEQAVRCSFVPPLGGTYRIRGSATDAQGRENRSELTLWVAGGDQPPARGVEQQAIQLIPDKKEYAVGERAKLLVMAPFAPAEGVVTLRREGLLSTRRISLKKDSTTLEIPIEDGHVPNLQVQVDLVGAAPRTRDDGRPDPGLPKRPAFAVGQIDLAVPPRSRALNLYLKPAATKLEPGGKTSLEVVVRDAEERPVAGGEVAVVVVDEAVLALSDYTLADPLATFFPHVYGGVQDHHSRASVVLASPEQVDQTGAGGDKFAQPTAPPEPSPAPGGGAAPTKFSEARTTTGESANRGGQPPPPIAVRTNFDALALFAAALPTDAEGRARVDIKLPDSLTRYRVMAVAVAGADRFGSAESAITARLPLMVRPSPPRFLNFGDRFELPVVLHNQTDAPLTVDLAARAANLDLTAGAGRKVQVPANDRVEVRLPAAAARPGTARFQLAAAAGKWSDAASGELPVWTPATTEAFATYGQIDAGAVVQPVVPPADAVPQFGGLELTTSSTAVAELTDAVLYLVRYPFECSEQLASRVATIAALRDVLAAFQAPGLPGPEALLASVNSDIERLARVQNPDGGWAFWRRGEPSWPYLTVHVAHALERARGKGFAVPPAALDRAQDYLRDIDKHIDRSTPREVARAIVAYALYVRARLGVRDEAGARRLYAEVALDKHSLETLGWLLPVLGDSKESSAILRHLNNQVRETAGAAHFASGYRDGAHLILHSDRRADGVLLDALIGAEPGSDLIPKLVRGLLSHRTAGHWHNTQENAFVLLALDRYFATYEKATPDFVARAWLGDKSAGEQRFKGRTTEQRLVVVPMPELAGQGARDLVLAKDGPGRLYYRLGLKYAPKDLNLPPADYGFMVERKYEALDDPADVRRDPDGTWRIRAGARVKVTLTMVAQDRRYHVALVDPLPAGLEAVNPALATTATLDPAAMPGASTPHSWPRWWWGPWYQHENLRDERVEAFTTLLWDGVHEYSYVARATTPGVFVVPPAKAEEMYAPETFGRSGGDRVIVE